jgi:septum formation protein
MARMDLGYRLILASASPRRKTLLAAAGFAFDVVPPPIPEPAEHLGRLSPSQQAEALAYFKARAVADEHADACVLAADTIVTVGDRVLGKPASAREAREMLETLSDTRQSVITGVALLCPEDRRLIASDCTCVTMRKMTRQEIDDYIASNEWVGKAGAYAIQETADRFVTKVEGSFTNVVGLPMELVKGMFAELRRHPELHGVL